MTASQAPEQPNVVYVQAPRKRRKWPYVVLGIVVLFVIIGVANSGSGGSSTSGAPSIPGDTAPAGTDAAGDVRVDTCRVETTTFATTAKIQVTVTNHTSQLQSYFVTIGINSSNGATRYGEATAVTNSLGAGQTTVLDAVGFPGKPPGAFTCSVVTVTRLPV